MTEYTPRDLIERMTALGAQLMPLKRGIKKPSNTGWTVAAALTVDQAEEHVGRGGNLGVNLGNSRFVAFDCEDRLASQAVACAGAGFAPTVIPAKAQYEGILKPGLEDPDSGKQNRKVDGSHVWLRVPDGIDPTALTSEHSMQLRLPNGGVMDVLAGPRYVVAPLSRLEIAYDAAYLPAGVGPLDLTTGQEPPGLAVAPMWLFDLSVPCPPELAPLHGCLIPRVRERVEQNARSIELSNQIDEVSWPEWIAGDHRISYTGEIDGCGCDIVHYQGASHGKSATLHDGCVNGNGAHIWSGTMLAELGLPGEHVSRLDLAVGLQGESRRVVAAGHGIRLGEERQELAVVNAAYYDRAAKRWELQGNEERAALYRQAAEVMRRSTPTPEQRGETFCTGPVAGGERLLADAVAQAARVAQASAPAPAIGTVTPTEGANALAPETVAPPSTDAQVIELRPGVLPTGVVPPDFSRCTSTTAEDPDAPAELTPEEKAAAEAEAAAEALADKRDPYRHLPDPCSEELEEAVFGNPLLPQVGAIRKVARAAAMSPWSTLGISIGRGLLRVRASVLVPDLVGGMPAPLNYQIGIVGASGRGKGAAHGLVVYDAGVMVPLDESVDKRFMPPSGAALAGLFVARQKDDDSGEVEVVQIREAAWCDWSEVDTLTAQSGRGGNDLAPELRAAISGAELGTDPKKDGADPIKVDPLSYRILVSFSTQYGKPAEALMAERDGGTLQRTNWFSTTDPRSLTKRPRGPKQRAEIDIMRGLPSSHVEKNPNGDREILTVDEAIWDEVWEAQAEKIRFDRDVDELAGHQNLNRLRTAAWAALIRHKAHIGKFEWEWAGYVMEHSRRVRDRLEASVKGLKKAQAVENGGLDFDRKNAAELAKVAHTEALLTALAKWGRDVREGRNKFGKSGPTFTLRDIKASAKNAQSERYTRASELATELCMRGVWTNEGDRMRSVEADPE
ncbi:bifunctional DNA primase/polymerase [Mycobacteroides abscessus]|uniref:bifunctional DNA primase/polymerase n=1 Tax=Mycobacteroides abscessus TaxID=36809 RepID=UPI00092C6180|nr:bifunctional DNA primase/polymerase [Mycobacteroides abscessus]SIF25288.1 bifunctional DNA primase/polymerase domain protein [Mycobacteroides abscessus subsp. abscessus]SIF38633.1 bifunctional DNA primase/polymerase domain protein [Mycobacteroides abscessus subsp. abscessus]SIF83823.1 bifunctional DNA primase/polymerase domain protein [Mycobacteroides abscessus subsp. abscessus]